MKKLLYVLPLMLALVASPLSSVQALDPPAVLADYDVQIDLLLSYLHPFQADYYALNDHYYQSVLSHSVIPSVPTAPDRLDAHPTDQPETLAYFWNYAADMPDELAWSFAVDVYTGPNGDGYLLRVYTSIDGYIWVRTVSYGPETYRTWDWFVLD